MRNRLARGIWQARRVLSLAGKPKWYHTDTSTPGSSGIVGQMFIYGSGRGSCFIWWKHIHRLRKAMSSTREKGLVPWLPRSWSGSVRRQFIGNPSRRQIFMVVDLDTPAKMAELILYILAWFVDTEPTFTPLMPPEVYGEAIANAKKIIQPHK